VFIESKRPGKTFENCDGYGLANLMNSCGKLYYDEMCVALSRTFGIFGLMTLKTGRRWGELVSLVLGNFVTMHFDCDCPRESWYVTSTM